MGLVCALGDSADVVWPRLRDGDTSHLVLRSDLIPNETRVFGVAPEPLLAVPPHLARHACRNGQLALAALEQIRGDVDRAIARHGPARVGVVMASSTAGFSAAEDAFRERLRHGTMPPSFHLVQLEFGGVGEIVADATGAAGPCYALSTACSAGAKALAAGRALLYANICDAVIAGAADSLCGLTANGFRALGALARGRSNPMSLHRDGIHLGEASAVFLLTRDADGPQLLGAGESSDAHHMSAPDPDGKGAEAAMRAALSDAGIEAGDIAYLNLHGTGTPQNDAAESLATARVLGTTTPCSSTKPLVGHTLGASGALEAAFCWLVLTRRRGDVLELPPHVFDGARDPALPPLALVPQPMSVRARAPVALLSSSFGFGGSNCCLVIGEPRT
jgi:3-oxoacyl-[acyl-carrier-protein] synthase-1